MLIIQHVKSIGGTERELTFEATRKGIIAVGYIEEIGKPAKYLHVDAYALKMAVVSVEQISQKEFEDLP